MPRPNIVLMGDSLTQLSFEGWGAKLADVYQRRADVLNRGYSGYTTRFYLPLPCLTTDVYDPVCLVILFFGANDAALADVAPHQHVPLEEYRQNLHALVKKIQTGCCQNSHPPESKLSILLVTPPPVHHGQRLAHQVQRYGPENATGILERTLENTGLYAAACQQVATELGLPCLHLYNRMLEHNHWDEFFHDGLHFSRAGHEFVGDEMVKAIQMHFPHLQVTADPRTGQWANSATQCPSLDSAGPFHDDIDHTDMEKAFSKWNK